jgi:phosphoribosylformylglycinamidine synthase I
LQYILTDTYKMNNIGIVVFPGTNCDRDVHSVLTRVLNINAELVWHTKSVAKYDAIIIPGGFSYGDRLRAGVIASRSPIIAEIKRMAGDGLPVLGICNGFQILIECGLLPGALVTNSALSFICRWTSVEVLSIRTPFTCQFQKNQKIRIPIAHGEGRYLANTQIMKELINKNRIILRYHEDDPNGSSGLIAGVSNEEGNVLGIMPHPERASETILVPDRSSNEAVTIFHSLLAYLSKKFEYY